MAAKQLTDSKVRAAKVAAGETLLADGENLYLRVRPNGKDWLYIYSLRGARRKQGLGSYPDVTLERARQKAAASRTYVADGMDPVIQAEINEADRRAAEAARAQRHTVRSLFEDWHAKEASQRKDCGAEVRRAFEKDILPAIGNIYADEIRRRHIMALLDDVKARGVGRYANVLLQNLRQMFRFAALREVVAGDPTFGLTKKNVGGAEEKRTRHLSQDEIRGLAGKLPASGLTPMAQAAFWIMLSTAARVGELSMARWSDVDINAGTWIIPAGNAKNGQQHLIHLSTFAQRQFETLRALATSDTWIFPNRDGSSYISTKTLQKQFKDRQRAEPFRGRSNKPGALLLATGEWRAHDLRRSAATLMGELGVRSDVIERVLNHIEAKRVVRIYQRQELLPERKQALERLGERLELLSRGKSPNVIPAPFGQAA